MSKEEAPKKRKPIEIFADAEPIKLGSMLLTLVEPHRGHEVAYNRWYERDHFYAGCMVGPYNFAGRRFVATADGDDPEPSFETGVQYLEFTEAVNQSARGGHVDAVIVVRGEIERCESAVDEALAPRGRACQKRIDREAAALRLQELRSFYPADRAHRAIHGRDDSVRVGCDRARPWAQHAREEIVEAAIAQRLRLQSVAHVRIKAGDEAADQEIPNECIAAARDVPNEARERVLRQEILQRDEQARADRCGAVVLGPSFEHQPRKRASMRFKSAANGGASNGGGNTATICA